MGKTGPVSPLLVAALLLGLTLQTLIPASLPFVPKVHAANLSIHLVGFIPAWNNTSAKPNPTITVVSGDAVSLALSSGDGAPHLFFIDVDGSGFSPNCAVDKCSSLFPPSTTYLFTVDFSAGSYKYYCSIHPSTMLADFVVSPGGVVGGVSVPVDRLGLLAPYIALAAAVGGAVAGITYLRRSKRADEA